jgi:hypothetical protein
MHAGGLRRVGVLAAWLLDLGAVFFDEAACAVACARRLRRYPRLPKPPHELQKNIDMTKPRMPTIIRIRPIVWMLNREVVTETAKRKMAPTAINRRPVPTPMRYLQDRCCQASA